jgi:hypothetical protein
VVHPARHERRRRALSAVRIRPRDGERQRISSVSFTNGEGPQTVDLTGLGSYQSTMVQQSGLTISAEVSQSLVNVLQWNGVGVVGGTSDNSLDPGESLLFRFAPPVTAMSYVVQFGQDVDGDGYFAEAWVEAYGADGGLLGVFAVNGVGAVNILTGCPHRARTGRQRGRFTPTPSPPTSHPTATSKRSSMLPRRRLLSLTPSLETADNPALAARLRARRVIPPCSKPRVPPARKREETGLPRETHIMRTTLQFLKATPVAKWCLCFLVLAVGSQGFNGASAQCPINPGPNVDQPDNQVVSDNSNTAPVTFSGTLPGTIFNWTNNTTSIGLAASGTGDIPSFLATNATNAPVTATITVTPVAGPITFDYTGSIVTWTVPDGVSAITITAKGAEGGDVSLDGAVAPGKGASMTGTFAVTPGNQYKILVGGHPSGWNNGGGGSFVTDMSNNPLIVAGGGGGGTINNGVVYTGHDSPSKEGQVGTAGGESGNSFCEGPGGTGGNGGGASGCGATYMGGGGGLFSGAGGKAFVNGGAGGKYTSFPQAGFGGGGSGSGAAAGGGGGGYSGGGAAWFAAPEGAVGGGGGSYNGGSDQTNIGGANIGNGSVVITYVTTSECIGEPKSFTITVNPLGPTASVLSLSGSSPICTGSSSTIAVAITGGTSPYTVVYQDDKGNPFTVSNYVSGSSIAVAPTTTTTYSLVSVTDANGNVGAGNSGSATVTVNALPVASCSISNPHIYFGVNGYSTSTYTVTPSGGVGPYTISVTMSRPLACDVVNSTGDETWTGNGGTTTDASCGMTPVSTYSGSAPYSVTVSLLSDADISATVTDANGCTSTICTQHQVAEDGRCVAGNSGNAKVAMCHHTGSGNDRTVQICVDQSDVAEHLAEGDELGACGSASAANGSGAVALAGVTKLEAGISRNPTSTYLNLSLKSPSSDPVSIKVVDVLGRVVESRQGVPANGALRLGDSYRPGVYLVQVVQGKQSVVLRMVKVGN